MPVGERAITVRSPHHLGLRDTLLVEEIVQCEDPEADSRRRYERLHAGKRSRCRHGKSERPDADAADERIADRPDPQRVRHAGGQVKDSKLIYLRLGFEELAAETEPRKRLRLHGLTLLDGRR